MQTDENKLVLNKLLLKIKSSTIFALGTPFVYPFNGM